MTITILILLSLSVLFSILILYFSIKKIYNYFIKNKDSEFNSDLTVTGTFFLVVAFLFLIFSFYSPFLFTRISSTSGFDFSKTGEIGDTLGGIMNPFIAICGVIVTGLAFYMQYNANQIQVKAFKKEFSNQLAENKLQKFESQFYEMIRLHKENVNEIKLINVDFFTNRRFKAKPNSYQDHIAVEKDRFESIIKGRECFRYFSDELRICCEIIKKEKGSLIFSEAYNLFWKGLNNFQNDSKIFIKTMEVSAEHTDKFLSQNSEPSTNFLMSLGLGNVISKFVLFNGHENELGHYYRHLFHTVKFVANQNEEFIDYEQKRNYLRLLRAQLSNYEQVMLFYNYLAYARQWENYTNKFLSDYRMIHNLYDDLLMDDKYFHEELKKIEEKQSEVKIIVGRTDDYIFEYQSW